MMLISFYVRGSCQAIFDIYLDATDIQLHIHCLLSSFGDRQYRSPPPVTPPISTLKNSVSNMPIVNQAVALQTANSTQINAANLHSITQGVENKP